MDISVDHFCMLSNFLDVDFKSKEISNYILDNISNPIKLSNVVFPNDWILIFHANYSNGKKTLVSKNKLGSFASDKMKYVTIVIPIPLISEIEWGVLPEQHLYGKDHYDKLMKNFFELDVKFQNYTNRTDYITACIKTGINKALLEGITVGGVKVKLKEPIYWK